MFNRQSIISFATRYIWTRKTQLAFYEKKRSSLPYSLPDSAVFKYRVSGQPQCQNEHLQREIEGNIFYLWTCLSSAGWGPTTIAPPKIKLREKLRRELAIILKFHISAHFSRSTPDPPLCHSECISNFFRAVDSGFTNLWCLMEFNNMARPFGRVSFTPINTYRPYVHVYLTHFSFWRRTL